jgi:hypothetical protein
MAGPFGKRHARCVAILAKAQNVAGMENVKAPAPAPAKRALAALDNPPAADVAAAPIRRISKKVQTAIEAMVSGESKTIADAAAKAGLARESLSRALNTPHIAAHLHQRVVRTLAIAAAKAGTTKVDLLDSDNAMARDRASSFILGLAGIAPAANPTISLNLDIRAGYIIDIAPEPGEVIDAAFREIPHV